MRRIAKEQWEKGFRVRRRSGFILAVTLMAALLSIQGAQGATPQPIEGDWEWLGGIIQVTATQPGIYVGRVLVPGSGGLACFTLGNIVWNLSGSGLAYTGTLNWVFLDDCSPAGPGFTTWILSSETQGEICSTDPTGVSGTVCDSITKIVSQPVKNPFHGFVCGPLEDGPTFDVGCREIIQVADVKTLGLNPGDIRRFLTREASRLCSASNIIGGKGENVVSAICTVVTQGGDVPQNPAFQQIGPVIVCPNLEPGVYK